MTKKQELNNKIKQLRLTISNIKIDYKTKYKVSLDVPDITNLDSRTKKFKEIYNDLMNVDLSQYKVDTKTGFLKSVGNSKYIKITRIVNNNLKTKTLKAEFTAQEYKELLRLQDIANQIRSEYGLKGFYDINFKRGTDFKKARQIILDFGNTTNIINNLNSFIDGLISNLDKAIDKADTMYNSIDVVIAEQLKDAIIKSRNIDLRETYKMINNAIDKIGTAKFNEFFSSDQEAIRDTGIMQSLIDSFGLNIDVESMYNMNFNNAYLGGI